ncbi:hypothetical protein BGZ94_008633 [Podila epigama]|nr:hypothetical protein BGZ94_008633 [Podila epigama]
MEPKKPISFAAAAASKPAPAPTSTAGSGSVAANSGSTSSTPSGNATHASTQATPSTNGKNGISGTNAQSALDSNSQSPSTAPSASVGSGQDKGSPSGNIDWVLGKHVKVLTVSNEVFEGQVYAYDVLMNCVAPAAAATPSAYYSPSTNNNGINNGLPRPRYDFRILKINYIKDVTPISPAEQGSVGSAGISGGAGEASPSLSARSNYGSSTSTSPNPDAASDITSNIYSTVVPTIGYVQLDKIQQRQQQAIREAQVAAARIGVGVSSSAQDIFDALSKTLPCRWAKDSIVVMDEVIIAPPYEPESCKANSSAASTLARVKKVLEGERNRLANGRK